MSLPKSNSGGQAVPFTARLCEWMRLLQMRLRGLDQTSNFDEIWSDLDGYEAQLMRASGKRLSDARVLEIGYGARPLRLIALMSMEIDVLGIDLDAPVLRGSMKEFVKILRANGAERLLKSLVRHFLFDGKERRDLGKALRAKGFTQRLEPARFLVGDVASDAWLNVIRPKSLDLVFSEDVFEHIARESLPRIMSRIALWLRHDGLALICPNIYTGITGGHLLEWYSHAVSSDARRASEPWEHLRKKRFRANTFLNELSRAEYRSIFKEHFEIVEENVAEPYLGHQWLSPELGRELAGYAEEELFSNRVQFVLRPRR